MSHSQVSEYSLSVHGSWRDLDQTSDPMAGQSRMCSDERSNDLKSVSLAQGLLSSHQAKGSANG
jgi:hypothetical protein